MKELIFGGGKIIIGRGARSYLKMISNKRVFIVTGSRSMMENGVIGGLSDLLKGNCCAVKVYTGIAKNPTTEDILLGVEKMGAFHPDIVLAVGGGSPMDAAKIMALFYEFPELNFEVARRGMLPGRRENVKLIAIPTTSGTASEVTRAAVVTYEAQKIKIGLKTDAFIPDIAILDAELTMGMPDALVAETGMDAVTHAVESYCGDAGDVFTSAMAFGAVEGLMRNLPLSYKDKTIESREAVHYYQCLAGLAFTNSSLGMAHGIAHAIGGAFNSAHGLINAVVLPYVLDYNAQNPTVQEKLGRLAAAIGAPSFSEAVRDLNERLNIPSSFKEMGILEAEFARELQGALAENALLGSTRSNPVKINLAQMTALLSKIYKGEAM